MTPAMDEIVTIIAGSSEKRAWTEKRHQSFCKRNPAAKRLTVVQDMESSV